MENIKKFKIYLGILYVLLISTFLYFFFSKFTLQELSSYEFIKNNVDYFSNLKDKNYYTLLLTFFLFVVFWVLLLGFGSPVALASGFISMGIDVILVGPLPTPALTVLGKSLRADFSVMITASHNPYKDNGLKFFSGQGQKISLEEENKIEDLFFNYDFENN